MPTLFLVNLPHDCTEQDVRQFVRGHGCTVCSIKLITDDVAHASPSFAYAELPETADVEEVAAALNGEKLRGRPITAKAQRDLSLGASTYHWRAHRQTA